MSRYSDLGKYIRDTIKDVANEENVDFSVVKTPIKNSSDLIYANIDELAILTIGDVDSDEFFNPLNVLLDGMI